MLNNFLDVLLLFKYPLIVLFSLFFLLTVYWKNIFSYFQLRPYKSIQRIHIDEVPRLGGLCIFIFFVFLGYDELSKNSLFTSLLIGSIPIVLIGFKEDMFHNTSPRIRLVLMIVSCLIFINIYTFDFPVIDIPYIGKIISIYPISIIFFIFSVLVVINGMNLIDGINGLFGLTALCQLLALYILSSYVGDYEFNKIILALILPLIIFLFFNFPYGKVFAGDLGAYLYGFLISMLTITFFGKYQNLISWLAVLILIYPCNELLFSYLRKFYSNVSPLKADNLHLHSLMYKKISIKKNNTLEVNFICIGILSLLWLMPLLAIIFNKTILSISIFLCLFIMTYLFFYSLFKD